MAADRLLRATSFQAWLYKIATNTCLSELSTRGRPRFLAARQWSGGPPPLAEIEHLQPYPDRLLDDASDPAARFDMRESVALAVIAVIQLLPARQRAVLLMRDVLSWSAREVANSLECSVASVNSALQRARSTVRARGQSGEPGTSLPRWDGIRTGTLHATRRAMPKSAPGSVPVVSRPLAARCGPTKPPYAPAAWKRFPIRKPTPAAPRPITSIFSPLFRQSPTSVTAE